MTDLKPDAIKLKKRSGKKVKIIGIISLVLALAVVGVSGLDVMTKNAVVQELQNISERISSDAKKKGAVASFTYEEVKMEGHPFDRKAIIVNPKFEYIRKNMFGMEEKSAVSTDSSILAAVSTKQKHFTVTLPNPIKISVNGEERYNVSSEFPPIVTSKLDVVDGVSVSSQSMKILGKTTIRSIKAAADGSDKVMTVAFDPESVVYAYASEDGKVMGSELKLSKINFATDGETLDIASLQFTTTEKPGAEGAQVFDLSGNMNDLGYKTKEAEGGPFGASFSMKGEYTIPQADAGVSAVPLKSKTMIEDITVTAKDYSIKLTGNIEQNETDQLPFGTGEVTIKNFAAIRDQKLFSERTPAFVAVVEQATGKSAAEITDANFTIKRETMGTFAIGASTFEQVMGAILANSVIGTPEISKQSDQMPPVIPDVNAPLPPQSEIKPGVGAVPDLSVIPTVPPVAPEVPPAPPVPPVPDAIELPESEGSIEMPATK